NGYAKARPIRIVGSTTVGQKTAGTVYRPNRPWISHDGNRRVEPSSMAMYQSGCEPELTWAGLYGPNSQIGLICANPPSPARTPKTMKKNPPALAAQIGETRVP